eukprot:8140837-Lingulodinium_polyedra.AAC.1
MAAEQLRAREREQTEVEEAVLGATGPIVRNMKRSLARMAKKVQRVREQNRTLRRQSVPFASI